MKRIATAVLSVVCAIIPTAGRDTLPHACTIPSQFAASLPNAAAARYATAERERTALSNQIASFESRCTGVPLNTPAYNTCVGFSAAVDANIEDYLRLLEDNQAALKAEVSAVRADVAGRIADLDRKIADTRAKLAADGARISGIEAAAKEWEDASEEARLETEKIGRGVFFDTIIDASLTRLSSNRAGQIAIDEREMAILQRTIGDLALPMGKKITKTELDILFEWERYFIVRGPTLVLRLNENRSNVELLKTLKAFNTVLDLVDTKNAWDGPAQREAVQRRYLTTLKTVIPDPGLKAILNQWDLNISLMYLFKTEYEAEQRVDQLSKLGGEALKGIASLGRLHKAQVDERTAVKRLAAQADVASASGCPF